MKRLDIKKRLEALKDEFERTDSWNNYSSPAKIEQLRRKIQVLETKLMEKGDLDENS